MERSLGVVVPGQTLGWLEGRVQSGLPRASTLCWLHLAIKCYTALIAVSTDLKVPYSVCNLTNAVRCKVQKHVLHFACLCVYQSYLL